MPCPTCGKSGVVAMMFWPNHERISAEISNDLHNNTSTIVLVPSYEEPQSIEYILYERLGNQLLNSQNLVLDKSMLRAPVVLLSEVFDVVWHNEYAPRTVQNFSRNAELPEVVLIRSFEHVDKEYRKAWLECIREFAEIRIKDRLPCPVFCIVARVDDPAINAFESGLGLKIHYWQNTESHAKIEHNYREADNGRSMSNRIWRAALLASLAGHNLELARDLSNVVFRSTEEILRRIAVFTDRQNWDIAKLRKENIQNFFALQLYTPLLELSRTHPIRKLWNLGLIQHSQEYGWEVPSDILSAFGCNKLLEHRIWRAQMKVVLPLIDRFRLLIISVLQQNHGSCWLTYPVYDQNGAVVELAHPYDVELFYLRTLLNDYPEKLVSEQKFLPALTKAHQLRNRLAHYETIEYVEYTELLLGLEGLGMDDY